MFLMKKEKEEEQNTQKKSYLTNRNPPPPRLVRSNPRAWKLHGPAYMSHVAEIFQLCLKCFYIVSLILVIAKEM